MITAIDNKRYIITEHQIQKIADIIDNKTCDDKDNRIVFYKEFNDIQSNPLEPELNNARTNLINKIINDFDSGDHPDLSDCNTTDEWYGHGWDDCRDNFVNYLKSICNSIKQEKGCE